MTEPLTTVARRLAESVADLAETMSQRSGSSSGSSRSSGSTVSGSTVSGSGSGSVVSVPPIAEQATVQLTPPMDVPAEIPAQADSMYVPPVTPVPPRLDASVPVAKRIAASEQDLPLPVSKPATGGDTGNKVLVYALVSALAFAAAFNAGPLLAPDFFQHADTGRTDKRKVLVASTAAACGAFLLMRCVY